MRSTEFPDEQSSILFVLSYMKGGSTRPWVTQNINKILNAADPTEPMWAEFMDLNHQATTRRKLVTLCQGDSSVEEHIQEFEIHRTISGLGNAGLIDHFEQVIHPWL